MFVIDRRETGTAKTNSQIKHGKKVIIAEPTRAGAREKYEDSVKYGKKSYLFEFDNELLTPINETHAFRQFLGLRFSFKEQGEKIKGDSFEEVVKYNNQLYMTHAHLENLPFIPKDFQIIYDEDIMDSVHFTKLPKNLMQTLEIIGFDKRFPSASMKALVKELQTKKGENKLAILKDKDFPENFFKYLGGEKVIKLFSYDKNNYLFVSFSQIFIENDIYLLDATAYDPWFYKAVFGVEVINFNAEYDAKGKIEVYDNLNIFNTYFTGSRANIEKIRRNGYSLPEIYKEIYRVIGADPNTPLITYKNGLRGFYNISDVLYKAGFKIVRNKKGDYVHMFNNAGLNLLCGYDLVVVGKNFIDLEFLKPWYILFFNSSAYFDNLHMTKDEYTPYSVKNNDLFMKFQVDLMKKDLIQTIGRPRILQNDVTIKLVTDVFRKEDFKCI